MNAEAVRMDVAVWSVETGLLPEPSLVLVAWVEAGGGVVDLVDGTVVCPVDDWVDFAVRWAQERQRRGRTVEAGPLARAIEVASGGAYAWPVCEAMAQVMMERVRDVNPGRAGPHPTPPQGGEGGGKR